MKTFIQLKTLLIALFITLSSVSYAKDVEIQKLSSNVYSIFIYHYQSLVVVGDKGVLVVDTANPTRAQILKQEISKLTKLPVSHIVLSHEHYDHTGGTEVFPDAKIYAQQNAKSIFKLDVIGQAPKVVHNVFEEETSITMGQTKVELHHYAAGDGTATTAVYLPKEKVVFSADMYEVGQITDQRWIEDSNFLGNRLILNELVKLNPKYAITAHSSSHDPKHLKRASDFYNALYDAVAPKVAEATKQGFPAVMRLLEELPKELKLEEYKDLKNYDHLPAHTSRMIFSIFHGG